MVEIDNGIDLNKMPIIYWSIETKMSCLQRHIIVYSLMYYQFSQSCVSDRFYDAVSRQLCELRKKYPEEYKRTQYYYAMYDFDGTTGFDIQSRLNKNDLEKLTRIAKTVLVNWQSVGGKVLW